MCTYTCTGALICNFTSTCTCICILKQVIKNQIAHILNYWVGFAFHVKYNDVRCEGGDVGNVYVWSGAAYIGGDYLVCFVGWTNVVLLVVNLRHSCIQSSVWTFAPSAQSVWKAKENKKLFLYRFRKL